MGTGRRPFALSALLAVSAFASSASARTTLVLDSWRDDDRSVREKTVAPAFEAAHPELCLQFRASAMSDCDAVLKARRAAGEVGQCPTWTAPPWCSRASQEIPSAGSQLGSRTRRALENGADFMDRFVIVEHEPAPRSASGSGPEGPERLRRDT